MAESTFYVAPLSWRDIILVEPALSVLKAQIAASKEPITMQAPTTQRFTLTVWQRTRTQASYISLPIKITCKEVTNYREEDVTKIAIGLSKVEELCNLVKEFLNLVSNNIPTELPALINQNHRNNPKQGSEW